MPGDVPAFFHSIPGIFVFLSLGGSVLYLGVATATYSYFFVRHRDRYLPEYEADPSDLRKAVFWGIVSVVGNAALTAPVHYLVATGRSAVYFDPARYGYAWLVASFFVYLFLTETFVYWIHRGLHHRSLYTWLHLKHHEFRKPTPFAGVAFNPLDSFLQALPHHVCALLLPVHVSIYMGMLTFVAVWAVLIHDRVSIVRHPFVLYTGHHTIHHHFNKYNYGQFFTFWDRWGGTYKSPFEQPAKFLRPRSVTAG